MGRILNMMAKAGVLKGLDADTIGKIMGAEAEIQANDDWKTLENGVHVNIGEGGKITQGPSFMEGKTPQQVSKESKAKAASKPKTAKAPASVKPHGVTTGTSPAKAAAEHFKKTHPGARNPLENEVQERARKDKIKRSLMKEMGVARSELPEAMRNKLHSIAQAYRSYGPDYAGERKKLLNEWNDNVKNAEAAGISHKEMNEIFHKPDVDRARKHREKVESGAMGEPGVTYDPQRGGSNKSSRTYSTPTKLSPEHEKKSVSKRDTALQKKLADSAGDKEKMKKVLDEMKPGTVLRYNERGYSLYTKQADGSWTYQSAFSDHAQPTTADKMFEDAQAWKDPKTGVNDPSKAFQGVAVPKKGDAGRNAEWDARRALANLEPNPGDAYKGKRVSLAEAKKNAKDRAGKMKESSGFPKEVGNASAEYTRETKNADGSYSIGVAVGKLKNGSGVTKINVGDITTPNPDGMVYNTLAEHCMQDKNGNLVLTPEREKLHQDIMEETFSKATPVPPGQKKTFTMLGGGSAAGKGTIQKNMPELFNQDSPVIDADEMKKRIPEYTDTAFSPDHKSAASMAHEESSALAKRAMQTAFANGFNCTLDGTGDGSLSSMKKKIEQAQANGYNVEGVYVTCPTELAVQRNANRSKTDEYNRLVNEKEVRKIHAKVSEIFPHVAPMMDHVVLYDSNRKDSSGKPLKIAECWKGQEPKAVPGCEKYYQEFLDKAKELSQ